MSFALRLTSVFVVGEGILFGDDGRWSEPNYATAGSAGRSPVSSGAPLDVACEDTLTSLYSVVGPRERLHARAGPV